MKIREIIGALEEFAPLSLQDSYDNAGLQIGLTEDAEATGALLCLDVTEEVLDEAVRRGCNMVVSHHPLLFRPCKSITGADYIERCVIKAIKNDIAVYSAHTNLDNAKDGVNYRIAQKLGLTDIAVLDPKREDEGTGAGIVGQLAEPMSVQAFMAHVAKVFGIEEGLRYVEGKRDMVQKIAICGGAGADLVHEAIAQGADVYVSADFKYHELQAACGQIAVVDMDHWVSEHYTREIFEEILSPYIHTRVAKADKSPVKFWR